MAVYSIQYTYHDDQAAQRIRADLTAAHIAFIRSLDEQKTLLLAGVWGPDDVAGGQIVIQARSAAEARQAMAADPYMTGGCISDVLVYEWKPVLGSLAKGLADA